MRILPEIEATRQAGGAIVALESTLISHGLPHPDNIEVARSAEAAVRGSGAVPATMAVLFARLKLLGHLAELGLRIRNRLWKCYPRLKRHHHNDPDHLS